MDRDRGDATEHSTKGREGEERERRKKGGGEKRLAVMNSIEAGLCGLQLTGVMDTHFSAAVPVMLHDESDSTLIRSIWKEISRECSVLGRKKKQQLRWFALIKLFTRQEVGNNSENPLITRSDNAFSLKKTIIVNIFEFTTIGSNMTWQMVCHTQPSRNEP